jgi:hypothetical protein
VKLTNDTGAVAYLHAVDLLEPELPAVVIVKKTYALGAGGLLSTAGDPLPLVVDQMVTDYGYFHGELFFRKRGVDVCVLGTARFDAPVRTARLRLEVGPSWSHQIDLVGDRVWARDHRGDLVPTAPAPFQEMPLGYARAFGGVAQVNGDDVQWPDNPLGRGYYETPDAAVGQPLPNIEPAGTPAHRRWDTRVPVAGWGPYPMYWGLRGQRAVKVDATTGDIQEIAPELFNHAHPDLILDAVDAGATVRVTGLRGAPIAFSVPRERPRVEVRVGDAVSDTLGALDGVFLWADADRVVVTWRARFRYAVRPEELRGAVLTFVE